MIIQIDTREKARAITKIVDYFDKQNIKHFSSKLPIGDYMNLDNPKLVIDRKQNLLEVCNNVCQDNKRFIAELERAREYKIKIIFLIEHSKNIKDLDDVKQWVNPRLKTSPLAVSGERLHKILESISWHYGCKFIFCSKADTGRRIVELLGGAQK